MSSLSVVSQTRSVSYPTTYLSRARKIVSGGRRAQAQRFHAIMSVADKLAHEDPGSLPGIIQLLGRVVQGRALASWIDRGDDFHFLPASVLFDCHVPLAKDGRALNDLRRELDIKPNLDLSRDIILPWPWEPQRVVNSLQNIRPGGKWGEWRQDHDNHCVELWMPWHVGWVYGGNHSIAAGIASGTGLLTPDSCFDISPIYKFVKCDGLSYRRIDDGSLISPVSDVEIAAIFEIGRKLC